MAIPIIYCKKILEAEAELEVKEAVIGVGKPLVAYEAIDSREDKVLCEPIVETDIIVSACAIPGLVVTIDIIAGLGMELIGDDRSDYKSVTGI